jgi:hypothetical protein
MKINASGIGCYFTSLEWAKWLLAEFNSRAQPGRIKGIIEIMERNPLC